MAVNSREISVLNFNILLVVLIQLLISSIMRKVILALWENK